MVYEHGVDHKYFMVWREKDGTQTAIPNLRTRHLEMIIQLIKRGPDRWTKDGNPHKWRGRFLPYLEEELAYRKRLDSNRETT